MDEKRELLRHFLAALAYRTQKALRGAPPEFGTFSAAGGIRTPTQLVRHMRSVLGYARTFFVGGRYSPDPLPSWEAETVRFHEMLEDLSQHLEVGTPLLEGMSAERLLQGPFSDAMTHAGQLAMLRRLAGIPVAPENFIVADIDAGRCGPRQADPVSPDQSWPEAPPGWVRTGGSDRETTAGLHGSLAVPLQLCEATRSELLATLARLPAGRWHARPSNGSWTVAQHVDHLIRAEVGTSKMARRLIRGDFRQLTKPPDARWYDSRLGRYPYGRLTAPAGLVPGALDLEEAMEQLSAVHRRFLDELLRFDGPDADALASPDPATGVWFTLAGWVCLQALHEAHHILQMQALLAMP